MIQSLCSPDSLQMTTLNSSTLAHGVGRVLGAFGYGAGFVGSMRNYINFHNACTDVLNKIKPVAVASYFFSSGIFAGFGSKNDFAVGEKSAITLLLFTVL